MPERFQFDIIRRCFDEILNLYKESFEIEKEFTRDIISVPKEYQESAKNLLHYMALRRHDIRNLQIELGYLGLSSLGRLEAHVLAGLESVLAALNRISGNILNHTDLISDRIQPIHFKEGDELLASHTERLLGPKPENRKVRIMVTLPSDAATNPELIKNLILGGMNVARINCAHDNPENWRRMVDNIRQVKRKMKIPCKILFDLGGPKLRTGLLDSGSSVLRIKAIKDQRGKILSPVRILVVSDSIYNKTETGSEYVLQFSSNFVNSLQKEDVLKFIDTRGRSRELLITEKVSIFYIAETHKSAYIDAETVFKQYRNNLLLNSCQPSSIEPLDSPLVLYNGDILCVTKPDKYNQVAESGKYGKIRTMQTIPCTHSHIFSDVKIGERIFFDDGKIEGIIDEIYPDKIYVKIIRAGIKGSKLRSEKGINLPDSKLNISSLSDSDLKHLDFAVKYADIIGLSFVNESGDVKLFHKEINKRTNRKIGVMLKIETRKAFENLPSLLLEGLRKPPLGVMVARGDLGIEVGFERMAEVQEQILWFCEAAHVPVVWATQVLEQMNKSGMPTRSEVTDAAMSARAECVMLNKGPFVVKTVEFLNNILIKMQDHHHKKTPMLRKLKVSEGRWDYKQENQN